MFGRAITLDRFTDNETEETRKYMFERWEDAFGKDCDEQLVELFVDEGSCGGKGVILYDGKNYWCPSYDQTDNEIDVMDWLDEALDMLTNNGGHDEEYWGKHGTDVPLII